MSSCCVIYACSVWIVCSQELGRAGDNPAQLTSFDRVRFSSLCLPLKKPLPRWVCQCYHLGLIPFPPAAVGRQRWTFWPVNTCIPLNTSLELTPCVSECLAALWEACCAPLMQNASIAEKFCSAHYMHHAAPGRGESNPGTLTRRMAKQRRRAGQLWLRKLQPSNFYWVGRTLVFGRQLQRGWAWMGSTDRYEGQSEHPGCPESCAERHNLS